MTAKPFVTCLWFDTQGEEAAQYYCSVFPGSKLGATTYYRDDPHSPDRNGQAMTVEFEVNGQKFVALNGGPHFTFNEAVSFQIMCKDQAEVDHYWETLTDGGEEGPCGWLKDRYGLSWQVVPEEIFTMFEDSDREKAARAMQAMYAQKKIDIAAIRRAYDGD